jgi:predicted small lipoprotein YifL
MKPLRFILLSTLVLALLMACGQKGPLYLPKPTQTTSKQ